MIVSIVMLRRRTRRDCLAVNGGSNSGNEKHGLARSAYRESGLVHQGGADIAVPWGAERSGNRGQRPSRVRSNVRFHGQRNVVRAPSGSSGYARADRAWRPAKRAESAATCCSAHHRFSSRSFAVHPGKKGLDRWPLRVLGRIHHEVRLDPNGFVQPEDWLELPGRKMRASIHGTLKGDAEPLRRGIQRHLRTVEA